MDLRPYQIKVIEDFEREVAAGKKRIILTCPTGGGKTVIASAIIKSRIEQRRGALVISHRREIIQQTADKLRANGIAHGIIMAGVEPRPLEFVQVASIQTLWVRGVQRETMELPRAELLIIDECHHAPANTYAKIIDAYPDAILLGLTATPCRGDGRGLGGIFETIIETPQVADLIQQGHLVKTRVYAPVDPDLRGVHTVAGDYNEGELADRMDRPKLIGDVVTGISTASAEKPSHSRSTSAIRSTCATSSSSPACAPNTSTARRQSQNAMPRSRASHQAKSS
jgi:superfamily II DNA or RNA helicase